MGFLLALAVAVALSIVGTLLFRALDDGGSEARVRKATLAHLKVGFVEITGRVEGVHDILDAPVSEQRCVQWTLRVDTRATRAAPWDTAMETSDAVAFLVRELDGGRSLSVKSWRWPWRPDRREEREYVELPRSVSSLLARELGVAHVPSADYRVSETMLAPGDVVNVLLHVYSLAPDGFDIVRISPESAVPPTPERDLPGTAVAVAILGVIAYAIWIMIGT